MNKVRHVTCNMSHLCVTCYTPRAGLCLMAPGTGYPFWDLGSWKEEGRMVWRIKVGDSAEGHAQLVDFTVQGFPVYAQQFSCSDLVSPGPG